MAITTTTTTEPQKDTGAVVESTMVYGVLPENEKPYDYTYPVEGKPKKNHGETVVPTKFTDLRSVPNWESEFTTDTSGFQVIKDPGVSPDLLAAIVRQDDERIQQEYYPLVEQLLLKYAEGSKKILIFDHTVRGSPKNKDESGEETPTNRQAVRRAHVDQSEWAGYERVRRHCPDIHEKLLKGRVRIINVWRPLRGPVVDVPLAYTDYRSIDHEKDLHASDLFFPGRRGEVLLITPNPAHKWYYVKEQTPDEVVFLKCFDTKEGVAKVTGHSAFDLPTVPEGALPRQSIEIRALVFDLDGTE